MKKIKYNEESIIKFQKEEGYLLNFTGIEPFELVIGSTKGYSTNGTKNINYMNAVIDIMSLTARMGINLDNGQHMFSITGKIRILPDDFVKYINGDPNRYFNYDRTTYEQQYFNNKPALTVINHYSNLIAIYQGDHYEFNDPTYPNFLNNEITAKFGLFEQGGRQFFPYVVIVQQNTFDNNYTIRRISIVEIIFKFVMWHIINMKDGNITEIRKEEFEQFIIDNEYPLLEKIKNNYNMNIAGNVGRIESGGWTNISIDVYNNDRTHEDDYDWLPMERVPIISEGSGS